VQGYIDRTVARIRQSSQGDVSLTEVASGGEYMRAFINAQSLLPALAGSVLLCSSLLAGDPKQTPSGLPPAAAPQFQAGDTLVVASERANLMLGDQVISVLGEGTRIVVVEFRDRWVGTHVVVQGQRKAGWVWVRDFLPANGAVKPGQKTLAGAGSASQPQVYAAAESTVSEAAEPAPRVSRPVWTRAAPERRDPFLIGKYDRHETDPNVHVWEPWRY